MSKPTCRFEDGRPVRARGLCSHHYSKELRELASARGEKEKVFIETISSQTSTVTPALAIVAHPRRAKVVSSLGPRVSPEVVVWDNKNRGCEANHRRAWQWLSLGADQDGYSVILEDDVIAVENFRSQLDQVLAVTDAPVVSLYLGRGRPPHWQPTIAQTITSLPSPDVCWLRTNALLSAQGYAVKTELLNSLLAGTTDYGDPIDEQVSAWVQAHDLYVDYTWPSIIEHRSDLKPLITGRETASDPRQERRVAWNFDSRSTWTDATIDLPTPEQAGTTVISA